MALTKAEILALDDRPIKQVDCPEWGGIVTVRILSCADAERMGRLTGDARWAAEYLAVSIVDTSGAPMFTVDEMATLLEKRSAMAARRLLDALQKLNAYTVASVEEIEGNSERNPSGDTSLH